MSELTKIDAAVVALLGYAVVFAGLVFVMVLLMVMGKAMTEKEKKAKKTADAASEIQETKANTVGQNENIRTACEKAPGTAGELKLYDTDPKDAAMVMAIVADTLNKPINELRFISIREAKG